VDYPHKLWKISTLWQHRAGSILSALKALSHLEYAFFFGLTCRIVFDFTGSHDTFAAALVIRLLAVVLIEKGIR